MAKLTAAARKALPASTFAGPGRSYPIPDKKHAIVAKGMAAMHASTSVKAAVDTKANRVLHGAAHASRHLGAVPRHGHAVMPHASMKRG